MTSDPTVRRNGTHVSVTLWAGEPTDSAARSAARSALLPGEELIGAGSQGQTFRYLVGMKPARPAPMRPADFGIPETYI